LRSLGTTDLVFSRFLGGHDRELDGDMVPVNSDLVVAGSTYSSDFPTAGGASGTAYDSSWNTGRDVFVSRLSPGPVCAAD
jgi:hypothetical protein